MFDGTAPFVYIDVTISESDSHPANWYKVLEESAETSSVVHESSDLENGSLIFQAGLPPFGPYSYKVVASNDRGISFPSQSVEMS